MRFFGHPVHVMLLHFPVALWPAHFLLQIFTSRLPPGAAASVGFWLLVGGTALGWLAGLCGAADLVALWKNDPRAGLTSAMYHAGINGTVLMGFTALTAVEYGAYPDIHHGMLFLSSEGCLLGALMLGNYFGGAVVWRENP